MTTFQNGSVWTALDTLVGTPSTLRNGVAWFKVSVGLVGPSVLASVANQGYVAVAGQNVDYGIVSARADGQALVSGVLVGPGYYPSTWYGFLHPLSGADAVHVSGAGFLPEDGFTCYNAFVGSQFLRGCRWGDYSDAGVNANGNFYFSAEYISSRAPGPFTNWGSFWATTPPG